MASTSPVPSRAALNALRGVLFTTSCSVILLAEERRRRLNVARAAIDNSKKLHTVRSNRGPIVLSEVWDGKMPHPGDEMPLQPEPKRLRNSYRRRRRDDLTEYILHDPDFEIHKHFSDHMGLELQAQEARAAGLSLELMQSMQRDGPRHNDIAKPLPFFTPSYLSPMLMDPAKAAEKRQRKWRGFRETAQPEPIPTPIPTETQNHDHATHADHQDTMAKLVRLLGDLEKNNADVPTGSPNVQNALAMLQQLMDAQHPTQGLARFLQREGLGVLKALTELDGEQVLVMLGILLPRSKGGLQVLYPYIQWLQETKNLKQMERLLEYLAHAEQSRFWMGGMLIYRLLFLQKRRGAPFEKMKQLYDMFLRAGLFGKMAVPWQTEYKIRRFMFLGCVEAGDDAFAQGEMEVLRKLAPEAFEADARLQGSLIAREASLGHWDVVRGGLDGLAEVADHGSKDFRRVLSDVADIFAQSHSAAELEELLRGFVSHYGIPLKRRWVDAILNDHAGRHDVESMSSWLGFCSCHGLRMDDGLLQAFYSRFRKYWSFSDRAISGLRRALEPSGTCTLSKSSANSKGDEDAAAAAATAEDEAAWWESEPAAVAYMKSLATRGERERLCETYDVMMSRGKTGFSAACLRLAVEAHCKSGEDGMARASLLIDEAASRGHDIADALTPLLLARLAGGGGDDPGALIRSVLARGIAVHDSVYNRAAQAMLARGDLRGAIGVCELAAAENGGRELLYSEYNFSNLVFAYTGLGRYGALQEMLARFTGEVAWWKGSPRCKESIKLAMKTTAMRAVVHPESKGRHEEALFRLDAALVHVKRCRARREDRRAVTEVLKRVVRGDADGETGLAASSDG